MSPSRIFSCFSFSSARLRCILIFFLSFFVKKTCSCGACVGSAKNKEKCVHRQSILVPYKHFFRYQIVLCRSIFYISNYQFLAKYCKETKTFNNFSPELYSIQVNLGLLIAIK